MLCTLSLWAVLQLPAEKNNDNNSRFNLLISNISKLLLGYGLFATGYIVYVTFMVAWMKILLATSFMTTLVWGNRRCGDYYFSFFMALYISAL